ncbi:MAG: ArsR/SmtB family transcription factor [Candidatus Helarchaeota archaeon]
MSELNKLLVKFFKALADPTRLTIIEFLEKEEKCGCEIHPALPQTQSTISLHLKTLVNAGILSYRQEGTRKLYSVKDEEILTILNQVKKLIQKWNNEKIQQLISMSSQS